MKLLKIVSIGLALAAAASSSSCGNRNPGCDTCRDAAEAGSVDVSGKADRIITGNIITMDPHRMRAEAMTVRNGLVQYVGSRKVAESLCDENTVRVDYGTASVYPGFMDPHVHPLEAGIRKMESIDLVPGKSVDEYLEIIREFVGSHPDKSAYKGAGWSPRDRELTAKDLDAICSDKPIVLNSIDGHSCWLNSFALKAFEFTKEVAAQDGPAMVHVDADGNPSGVVVEEMERIASHSKPDVKDEKEALMLWQDFAFSLGMTAVGDAGFASSVDLQAYKELEDEGKFKLLTYDSYYQPVPGQSVEDKVSATLQAKADYEGRYFKVTGIKMFVDGVVEGHTAWLIDDYLDQPGYTGVKKLDDHAYLVDLVKSANENGLYVHLHTIGDGAVKFVVDAIEDAQRQTGIYDAHNCMAHLQLVRPEDVKRMADNNIVAIVPPLWTPYFDSVSRLEEQYIGSDRCTGAYPIKSFIDNGAVICFHSDYPVSTSVSIPKSIAYAELRSTLGGKDRQRAREGLSRIEALKAMTVNVAYAFGDSTIGSLECGKKANYAVFDSDFLSDPVEKVLDSKIVATAVEGEVVYKAE